MIRLDDLLIDNYKIYQDDSLYTFTSDAVLLSKFTTVKKGDIVADFCAGSGIIGLHLYLLNKEKIKSVRLFELQTAMLDLSKKSIEYNNLSSVISAEQTDLSKLDTSYAGAFSLITCNPPYMESGRGEDSQNEQIAICKSEVALKLEDLIKSCSLALKFGGRLNMVHRADRLADIIYLMRKFNIEPKKLQLVLGAKDIPYLVLIEGVKGGKKGLKHLSPIKN